MTRSLTFYAVAAQVVPLLFVVLAIEQRVFSRVRFYGEEQPQVLSSREIAATEAGRVNHFFSLGMIWAALMMVSGEVAALWVLASGREPVAARGAVWSALIVGGVAVVGPVLRSQWKLVATAWKDGRVTLIFFVVVLGSLTWLMIAMLSMLGEPS